MKYDPVDPVACPLCGKVLMTVYREVITRTENSTRGRRRAAIFRHLNWAHPELGLREKSVLADQALDAPIPLVEVVVR